MKLLDRDGNEITSKQNDKAQELEKQMSGLAQKVVEPIINKLQLTSHQITQDQFIQLTSMAHQMIFNRMIFNLILKTGVDDLNEIVSEVDLEELKTAFSNQIRFDAPAPGTGPERPQA